MLNKEKYCTEKRIKDLINKIVNFKVDILM